MGERPRKGAAATPWSFLAVEDSLEIDEVVHIDVGIAGRHRR